MLPSLAAWKLVIHKPVASAGHGRRHGSGKHDGPGLADAIALMLLG